MRRVILTSLLASLWLGAAGVRAEPAERLRLDDVIDEAQRHNPALEAARAHARALAAVPAQVSAYDDPTVSWEGWNIPESLRIDHADNNIFRIAQKIPWPGKRTLAGTVAEHETDIASQQIRVVELDIAAAVTRAYYDLWLTYQKRDILARDKSLVEQFAHVAEQKYAVGQATQADTLRAQVELTHMIIDVNTATLAISKADAELNALLSRRANEPLGVPEDPPRQPPSINLDILTDLALQERPEIAAQHDTIAREQSGVELARINRRPDFEFSVGRFINYGQSDGFGAMASVTVPFVYAYKYDAESAEAQAKLASAQADLRRWQDAIRSEVAQAYVRVRTAALQHDLALSTHVPQAEQALRVSLTGYQAGSVDFLSLIDSVRAIVAVHTEHVEAAAELAKAVADLERAVGGELPPAVKE